MAKQCVAMKNGVPQAVRTAKEVLENGGVAIFPTETVYGIGVLSGNAEALEKLRRLKSRGPDKPFQFLVADVAMAKRMGAVFPEKALRLANNYWPGPMTMVVPDGTGSGTIGIRVPSSPFVLALCRELARPIITSSANAAGAPPPVDATAADIFGDEADLLVDGGTIAGGVPSTVVRVSELSYEILRLGGVTEDAIDAAWNE